MDETGFRKFLKRAGKKDHVVDGLVARVKTSERFLTDQRGTSLETAGETDIGAYADTLDQRALKAAMRALALYYRFTDNPDLAKLAAGIREREVARTRRAFKLRDFRGVDPQAADRLEAAGIISVEDMLAAGSTPEARLQLVERTGLHQETVLELVKLSDLSRLGAIKSVRARLYYEAGLETPESFTAWEPEALRGMLVEFVERSGFDGIAPLPKEVANAIGTAQSLPKVVEY